MLQFFSSRWDAVPTIWIDTETTGVRPGVDRVVQVGFARFERGEFLISAVELVDPGVPIPAEATAIHGITDAMVRGKPRIEDVFQSEEFRRFTEGAQPGAYNAAFDRHFVPPFGDDWTWPWLDSLSLVRFVDKYERGKGRHKLENAAPRHGVKLAKAHNAGADARAAGELFYCLVPKTNLRKELTLGALLRWQRQREADSWFEFQDWRSQQPPQEAQTNG